MPSPLPIDLESLTGAQRDVFDVLLRQVAELEELARRQEALIKELRHVLRGKRSEKLSEDERQLSFEDLEIAVADVEAAQAERKTPDCPRDKKKPPATATLATFPRPCRELSKSLNRKALTVPVAADGCTRSAKSAANGWTLSRHSCG